MIRRTLFTRLLLPCVYVTFLSCGDKKQGAAGGAPPVKDYAVLTITPQTTTLYTDYPASIQGQENVEIRPKIDGYVDKIYVDEGSTVTIGQKLFRINAPQYEQGVRTAEADIKIAQADVKSAEMQVNKVRPLVEKKIISNYELESAQYNLQAKQAALAQARATLENARINYGYTMVTSPVNGVVGTIPYKIGSLVSSTTTQPLTTVSNITKIYAYFSINEKQALAFSKNAKGRTTQEKLASIPPVSLILANGTEFPDKGRIETASGLINVQTGSISVRATFPNPGNIVRSGSSGLVRIYSPVDSAILVPQRATYEIQGKTFVYVLGDSAKVESKEIRVRVNSGGQFFVVEEGINPGDKIVIEGVATLTEGASIKPRQINADSLYRRLTSDSTR
jgi:membrane fusion protein, multidrug efflux system